MKKELKQAKTVPDVVVAKPPQQEELQVEEIVEAPKLMGEKDFLPL